MIWIPVLILVLLFDIGIVAYYLIRDTSPDIPPAQTPEEFYRKDTDDSTDL